MLVEHDISLLTPTIVVCMPASSGQKRPWHDEACSRPGSAPFLAELQPTPGGQHCLVQLRWKRVGVGGRGGWGGGSSLSRIQTDIWSQTCRIEFMSGLRAGQSMTSTPCWSKKAAVSRAVWGGALSWTYTKLHPNTSVAHLLRIWMYRCRFMAPSTTTSSLLPHGGLHPIPWLMGHDFHH